MRAVSLPHFRRGPSRTAIVGLAVALLLALGLLGFAASQLADNRSHTPDGVMAPFRWMGASRSAA